MLNVLLAAACGKSDPQPAAPSTDTASAESGAWCEGHGVPESHCIKCHPKLRDKFKAAGRMNSLRDLQDAVEEGAVKRIRPKMMTVMAILMGLLPIMWSHGAGADVMKRIAAPMVGGVITSFVLELLIYPVIFTVWKWHQEVKPAVVRANAS